MNLQNNNENIINLIHHEYIQVSFLFNKSFMQRSFYIFMIKKNWIVKHAIILVHCGMFDNQCDFVTRHK
jgi:hypothetical protein